MAPRHHVWAGIAGTALALAAAGPAAAAQRYAAPGNHPGAACTAADPCSLPDAVNGAGTGDEVIVRAGDYNLGSAPLILNDPGMNVHGVDDQPRPSVRGATAGTAPLVDVTAAGVSLHRLALRQTGSGGPGGQSVTMNAAAPGATGVALSDLVLTNTAAGGTAARLGSGVTLASSTAHALADPGVGVTATGPLGGPVLRNVTAWGTGASGAGIRATDLGTVVTAFNTIARAPGAAADLIADQPTPFNMTSSNFATSNANVALAGAGNQSAGPLLANATGGDFHQRRGSPTVNAGTPDPLAGLTDIDGQPRLIGLVQDIGADELAPAPPAVSTGDPLDITGSGGRLTGTVNPNGLETTYRFDYGPTPLYGNSTPAASAGAGNAPVTVEASIGGLATGSIVHYRLVASSADGETAGLDRVLILLPPLPGEPGGPLPGTPGPPQFTDITLPLNVVAGEPFTLSASGTDPDDPVSSIRVDFGDGPGYFIESACRLSPRNAAFQNSRVNSFDVSHAFSRPGVYTVEVTLGAGDCGRPGTSTRTTVQVNVAAAKTLRSQGAPVTGAGGCKDAGLRPTRRNLRRIRAAMLCVINEQRAANGRRRVGSNGRLRKAAAFHNGNMRRGRFFAHQGPREPNLGRRIRRYRYRGGAAENLGAGSGSGITPGGMAALWMASTVHRVNMLEPKYLVVGIDVMTRKPLRPTRPGATYTVVFGTRRR